jgi:hypothetical protein
MRIPRNGCLRSVAAAALLFPCPAVVTAAELSAPAVPVTARSHPDLEADSPLNPYRLSPSSRATVHTFSAEDIVAIKPRDVFDLLNQAVGVFAMSQGRKVPNTVRIRGETNFAYLVDGV